MKASDYLKAIAVLLDSLIKDVEEWEKNGCKPWCLDGARDNRTGATQTGIRDNIRLIRKLLIQVSKDIESSMKA